MRKRAAAVFVAAIAMSATARADQEDDKNSEANDKPAVTAEAKPSGRMTLPGGTFYINGVVETNLASGATGKPISLAPDLWYGASDKLTLGLVHSSRGSSGFLT